MKKGKIPSFLIQKGDSAVPNGYCHHSPCRITPPLPHGGAKSPSPDEEKNPRKTILFKPILSALNDLAPSCFSFPYSYSSVCVL